jgi:hypothetical protein
MYPEVGLGFFGQRAATYLGCDIPDSVAVHNVRDVGPFKAMLCLSFQLPEAAAKGNAVRKRSHQDDHTSAVGEETAAGGASGVVAEEVAEGGTEKKRSRAGSAEEESSTDVT